ncbi:aminopeptidase Y [Ophiocordyceps sinensis CO18]|uniref:Peptide hydrolase n=1 Tax=Ophiocordyceps sinensis (strain Co18 / CGMCC 3.14243) TaxID=911162 RepID=T5AI25_OPHSC|nr:aminopeptidase Y [Ophiocordyceps sinensis CO18]
MKLRCNVLSVALLAAGPPASTKPTLDADQISDDLSWRELRNNVLAWNLYSEVNRFNPAGFRAMGSGGFQQSVNHVIRGVQRCRDMATHHLQRFNFVHEKLNKITLDGPVRDPVAVSTVRFNTASGHRGVTGELVPLQVGCYEDQWTHIGVRNRIALVRGGQCNITDKVKLAKKHGARAVIFYDEPTESSLNPEDANKLIPVGIVSREVGEQWSKQFHDGKHIRVKLNVGLSTKNVREAGINVIAETTTGSPDHVIMIGARLDSPDGPGLNDPGSGAAALLELLETIHLYTGYFRRIRFAWWGGEFGPEKYMASLSPAEAAKIRVYLDVNTIASHNPNFTIFSYDDADKVLAGSILTDYLTERSGVNATYR